MSYDLCIWDPAWHPPLPTSADDALAMMEQLSEFENPSSEKQNAALVEFARLLVERSAGDIEFDPQTGDQTVGLTAFWGCDPRQAAAQSLSAVLRLPIPSQHCIRQIAHVVKTAQQVCLVVFDDENGMCFLPDGTLYPPDMREIWESDLQDLADRQSGRVDPSQKLPDGRTVFERIGGELFDALGRGNRRQ